MITSCPAGYIVAPLHSLFRHVARQPCIAESEFAGYNLFWRVQVQQISLDSSEYIPPQTTTYPITIAGGTFVGGPTVIQATITWSPLESDTLEIAQVVLWLCPSSRPGANLNYCHTWGERVVFQ